MTPATIALLSLLALTGCFSPAAPPSGPGHKFYCADANQSYPRREQRKKRAGRPACNCP